MHNFQNNDVLLINLFSKQVDSCRILPSTVSHKRNLTRLLISSSTKDKQLVEQLSKMELNKPYTIISRIGNGLHQTMMIRVNEKKFYYFDPNRGLHYYEGNKGMGRLERMFNYGKRTPSEIKYLKAIKASFDQKHQRFIDEHALNAEQKLLIESIKNAFDKGLPWEEFSSTIPYQEINLARHYYEHRRLHSFFVKAADYATAPNNSIGIYPFDEYLVNTANNIPGIHCQHTGTDCEPMWN